MSCRNIRIVCGPTCRFPTSRKSSLRSSDLSITFKAASLNLSQHLSWSPHACRKLLEASEPLLASAKAIRLFIRRAAEPLRPWLELLFPSTQAFLPSAFGAARHHAYRSRSEE